MKKTSYGCHNRAPFSPHYFATGGTIPIPHVFTITCQYTHTTLGQADRKCIECQHREDKK